MTRARIEARFAALREEGRAALVTFVTAGDPDLETSLEIIRGLPAAGADLIEIGMPFSDPMADGPAIQASSLRALRAGITLSRTLGLVSRLRESDAATPVVLMGYYNPIYVYGVPRFLADARAAGVDGIIVVDLPPEEDEELCLPAAEAGLAFIRLATPTTDAGRLPAVLAHASGFLYYVSITGITGAARREGSGLAREVARLKSATALPVAVGFGLKTPQDVAAIAALADGAVVGSAIVQRIAAGLDAAGRPGPGLAREVLAFVASLATGVRGAERAGKEARP